MPLAKSSSSVPSLKLGAPVRAPIWLFNARVQRSLHASFFVRVERSYARRCALESEAVPPALSSSMALRRQLVSLTLVFALWMVVLLRPRKGR